MTEEQNRKLKSATLAQLKRIAKRDRDYLPFPSAKTNSLIGQVFAASRLFDNEKQCIMNKFYKWWNSRTF